NTYLVASATDDGRNEFLVLSDQGVNQTPLAFIPNLEPIPVMRLRRFSGLFGPIFDPFCGGCILLSILPPQKRSKIGPKEPENRQKLITGIGSSVKEHLQTYQRILISSSVWI